MSNYKTCPICDGEGTVIETTSEILYPGGRWEDTTYQDVDEEVCCEFCSGSGVVEFNFFSCECGNHFSKDEADINETDWHFATGEAITDPEKYVEHYYCPMCQESVGQVN